MSDCPVCDGRGWHTAGGNDPAACGNCEAGEAWADGEDAYADDDDLECTHCGGEGFCWAGSDPLGNCPDSLHRCHACAGSGRRKDQTLF